MSKLTVKEINSLVKDNKIGRHSDGEGLYLMLRASGKPYWVLRYTLFQKRRTITLGKLSELPLKEARLKAAEQRKLISEGIDPIAKRKSAHQVSIHFVDDLFEDWHQELSKRLKHPNIPARIYRKEIAPLIGQQQIKHVTPLDIRQIVQKVANSGRPTIANDTLMYCKQMFRHAVKFQFADSNPALALEVSDAGGIETARERYLSIKEIEQVFAVFRENMFSFGRDNYLACALLLCLGVRKGELTEAKWEEFDLENAVWSLPSERSKTGSGFEIPLPTLTVEWLEELHTRACGSEYVFPNRRASKVPHMGKDTLNRAIAKLFGREAGRKQQPPNKMGELEYFSVHDLRRTCRSLLASAGVPSHIAERCLNHKLKGVEGIYDKYDYMDERKDALEKVATLLCHAIESK